MTQANNPQDSAQIIPFKTNRAYLGNRAIMAGGDPASVFTGGGGGDDGMDPWQTSVEGRLDSLDRRLTSVETGVNDMRERLARVETKIEHLPSKDFVVRAIITTVTVMSIIVGLIESLIKIIHF